MAAQQRANCQIGWIVEGILSGIYSSERGCFLCKNFVCVCVGVRHDTVPWGVSVCDSDERTDQLLL
jgi:hypothetical protein